MSCMVLIVMSGKCFIGDTRKIYTYKVKDPLPIEKWILYSDQPVGDDLRTFFVAMTQTLGPT